MGEQNGAIDHGNSPEYTLINGKIINLLGCPCLAI